MHIWNLNVEDLINFYASVMTTSLPSAAAAAQDEILSWHHTSTREREGLQCEWDCDIKINQNV